MYWPLVGIGATLQQFMVAYREVFCREAGFEHVSRYINGLLLSANKTLQGIYTQIVWSEGKQVSRRAMHEAVFEAGWSRDCLMQRHRQTIAPHYRSQGRAVMIRPMLRRLTKNRRSIGLQKLLNEHLQTLSKVQ